MQRLQLCNRLLRRACWLGEGQQTDSFETLEDPAHRRPIRGFAELVGNRLSGGRQLLAQAVLCQPIDQQTQHHHQTERHDTFGLFHEHRGGEKERILVALFPNGRFAPRWMGWLLLGICLIDLPANLFPTMPFSGPIEAVFALSGFPLVAASMIYRYRRVSTPVERQQTKWVVFGVTLVFFTFMLWLIPQIVLFSSLSQPGSLYDLIGHPLFLISTLAIPICIGIAILRYRLWDIDVLINKALDTVLNVKS